MQWRDGLWARTSNLLLSGWLIISAFAWDHSPAQRVNAVLVGYLCFLFALFATGIPKARRANSLLAVWLFLSAWTLPHVHTATQWNNALVAMSMFLLSLVPGWSRPIGGREDILAMFERLTVRSSGPA